MCAGAPNEPAISHTFMMEYSRSNCGLLFLQSITKGNSLAKVNFIPRPSRVEI